MEMNDPREWTEDDVLNLATGEHDWFEAKGRKSLDITLPSVDENKVRETLAKAVSAFANSGGGVLVYGITGDGTGWKVDDGGVPLHVKRNTREWLEDIIPVSVDPHLKGFNVYAIELSGTTSQIGPGQAIYLVSIPDSEQAPHQSVFDKVYYGRLGGKSVPLGHRFVADIFSRRRDPVIEPHFTIEAYSVNAGGIYLMPGEKPKYARKTRLLVELHNTGRVYAQFVKCLLYIPIEIVSEDDKSYRGDRIVKLEAQGASTAGYFYATSVSNTERDIVHWGLNGAHQYGPVRYDPILPGSVDSSSRELLSTLSQNSLVESSAYIRWIIFADNAPQVSEIEPVSTIPFNDTTRKT